MRVTGILLMAGTLIAGGFALAERGKERLQGLERLRQMVYHLMNRILYANVALPDALEDVGRRFRGRESEFFLKTAERLKAETDMTFASIWMEEAERFFQVYLLPTQLRYHSHRFPVAHNQTLLIYQLQISLSLEGKLPPPDIYESCGGCR